MKAFKIESGIITTTEDDPQCHNATVIDGGYATSDGGFWASIELKNGNGISGKIKDQAAIRAIIEAYLSESVVRVRLG